MAKNKQITLNQHEWNSARQIAFVDKIIQSKHGNHNLGIKITHNGPHGGKIVCESCNKHVAWIPKAILETI